MPSRIATSSRIETVATKVAAATAKSWRLKRQRRCQLARSNSDHEISSSKAAIAGSGISASSGALSAARASSQSDANTAASGVRAPASRFGSERLSEPHETYDENMPPTMFDRPWPRNSRLASMCWPERSAIALAIEIDWPRATIVSAKAMPTRSGSVRRSTAGSAKRGQIDGIGPTILTCSPEPSHQRSSANASALAAASASSIDGERGASRLSNSAAKIVNRPTASAGHCVLPMFAARCVARVPSRCAEGAAEPEQLGQRIERDQRRGAAREAAQRCRRDEVGERAEAQQADQELHRADEHGDREGERDVGRRADHGERRESREQGERIGVGRSRDDVPARAEERSDDARNDRRVEPVLRWQTGQGGEGEALRQDEQGAEHPGDGIGAQRRPVDAANPEPEDARGKLVHWSRLSRRAAAQRPGRSRSASERLRSPSRRSVRARGSAPRSGKPKRKASRRCRRGPRQRHGLRRAAAHRAPVRRCRSRRRPSRYGKSRMPASRRQRRGRGLRRVARHRPPLVRQRKAAQDRRGPRPRRRCRRGREGATPQATITLTA